jgi:uncharacterized membrane protein
LTATATFQIPTDEPATVLLRLVRKAKLPYSSRFVSGAVGSHPQSQSLLALVQVAPHVGLRVTAAKVEPDGLDDLHLPAVVHFAEGAGGFGVLERVTPAEVELWDGRYGRQRVDRAAFLDAWSGIVALAERDDSERKTDADYRKQRLVEMLGGTLGRPDLARPPEGRVLTGVTAAILALLAAVSTASHPSATRWAAALVVVLALAGLGVGAILSYASADTTAHADVPGCPRGKLVNCESVLKSEYSKVRGIPMADLGTSFFGATIGVAATAALFPDSAVPWTALAYAFLAAVPAALLLVGAQVVMRKFCTMCLVVHGLVLAGAAAAWTFAGDAPLGDVWRGLALFAVYFSVVLFVAIPFFQRETRTRRILEVQARVAGSPFATLAHLSTEPATPLRGAECGIRLPGPPSPHELVLFAHPTCKQCSHVLPEIGRLAAAGATEVYVTLLPRYGEGDERRLCEVLLATGVAGGAETFARAFAFAKKRFFSLMEEDFTGAIAAETGLGRAVLEGAVETARRMIAHADAIAEDRIEGTPALVFDTRMYPFGAPVAHLALLLQKHASLLPQRPGVAEREGAPA